MPTYDYECNICQEILEIKHSIHDEPITTCPKCGTTEALQRLISPPMYVSVRLGQSEIASLKHLAERNTEGMSGDERANRERENVTKKMDEDGQVIKTPQPVDQKKSKLHKKINRMTPQQKKAFIEKGTM
jgi:putative FmdB family regulatory protein